MVHAEKIFRKLTILVCDPDAEFVREANDILRAAGHQVLVATDRSRAMRLLLADKPQVIIIPSEAFNWPESEYMAAFLRTLPDRPVVVIAMTFDRFDLAWQAWQLGADEAVFKPLLCDTELIDAVDRAMGKAISKSYIRNEYNSFQHQR